MYGMVTYTFGYLFIVNVAKYTIDWLVGGFKYCLFSPQPGEMIQFD